MLEYPSLQGGILDGNGVFAGISMPVLGGNSGGSAVVNLKGLGDPVTVTVSIAGTPAPTPGRKFLEVSAPHATRMVFHLFRTWSKYFSVRPGRIVAL
jgi:hypothetical protein